jgi:hypothetical protein
MSVAEEGRLAGASRVGLGMWAVIGLFFAAQSLGEIRLVSLWLLVVLSMVWGVRTAPSRTAACQALVAWTALAWLFRVWNVGATYADGGLLADTAALARLAPVDPYFPFPLSDPYAYAALHVVVPASALVVTLVDRLPMYRAYAALSVVAALAGMLSQFGMANQLMTTTFWTGLFLFVLTTSARVPGRAMAWLGQVVVSFVFVGPFIGKATTEYWSNAVPDSLGLPRIPFFGLSTGQVGLVMEGVVAAAFVLGPAAASFVSVAVMAGMLLAVSPSIMDAVGPVIGLCVATQVLRRLPG